MTDKIDDKLNDSMDQIFDEDKLDNAIKKGKRRSTKKTVVISIIAAISVFILVSLGNTALTVHMSNKSFQTMDAYIRVTVPNGYISSSVDTFGFLGGRSDYTISRKIGSKPVILENKIQTFGLLTYSQMNREVGGEHVAGQWPKSYWEYGYNRMMFFHPKIDYKEYKNDLEIVSQVADDKIIQMGLSLDKPYTISEISEILSDVNISWYWIDTYPNEIVERYTKEAREYDSKSTYIPEFDALGVSIRSPRGGIAFDSSYNNFLYDLKSHPYFQKVYDELNLKGYTNPSKVPILGVIVQGSKKELNSLIDNPHIKASSFGVITDKY